MGKPKSRDQLLRNQFETPTQGLFISTKDGVLDAKASAMALEAYEGFMRADASRDAFKSIDTNITLRNEFTRDHYETFRPAEAVPRRQKEIIMYCGEAYRKIGVVRNVIDLMGDFGSQGIQLNHPNPRIQEFYRKWFERVGGPERSERFLNYLYRFANIIIRRMTAKIGPLGTQKLSALGAKLEADGPMPPKLQTSKGVIPIAYRFMNPQVVEIAGGELAQFIGHRMYAIRLSPSLRRMISYPTSDIEKQLVASLPQEIKNAASKGDGMVLLDQNKICVYHYKKDDWQEWADPMLYSILDDLILLEKMKLADLSALDGVISQIRVWKLGHLNDSHPDMSLFPTDTAVSKLADILMSNPGGGAFDLIWGPDIEVEELKTDVHNFLGATKYEPVWNNIHAGLGVPPTLTGASTAPGMTNNFISLKTLIQRLEYGRTMLTSFWNQEIELVRQAMSFKLPATVHFDRMVLSDEAAEKQLIKDMFDRNLISTETAIERLGESYVLERLRQKREARERESGNLAPKAGPWHEPEKLYKLTQTALQRALISPKQSGLDIEEDYEDPPFLMQLNKQPAGTSSTSKNKGQPGQGRPKGKKDTQPRQERTPKIRTSANVEDMSKFIVHQAWAKEAYGKISELVTPVVLSRFGKKNLRALSAQQFQQLEDVKFDLLMGATLFSEITPEYISSAATTKPSFAHRKVYQELCAEMRSRINRDLTVEELRNIQSSVYALIIQSKE